MKLSEDQKQFLEDLRDGNELPYASYHQTGERQKMKKAGFAKYFRGEPQGWIITDAGRKALEDNEDG